MCWPGHACIAEEKLLLKHALSHFTQSDLILFANSLLPSSGRIACVMLSH